jgi:hypothetical protein
MRLMDPTARNIGDFRRWKDPPAGGSVMALIRPACPDSANLSDMLARRFVPDNQRVSTMWVANSVGTVSVTR